MFLCYILASDSWISCDVIYFTVSVGFVFRIVGMCNFKAFANYYNNNDNNLYSCMQVTNFTERWFTIGSCKLLLYVLDTIIVDTLEIDPHSFEHEQRMNNATQWTHHVKVMNVSRGYHERITWKSWTFHVKSMSVLRQSQYVNISVINWSGNSSFNSYFFIYQYIFEDLRSKILHVMSFNADV